MRVIKAVFFDLDNTLIDFMKMKRASCEAAISAMISSGLNIEHDAALKALFELYDHYGIEYNLIFQRFLEKTHTKVDYKILTAGIVAYRRVQQSLLQPYPKVVPILLQLKQHGIRIALVTDAPRLKAWIRLTELGLQDFFDVVVAYGDVRERKPSKMPFQRALRILGLEPHEVLMVGDWPERDIKGAKAMGIKSCFARYGYVGKEIPKTDADYEIDALEELLQILK